MKHICLFSGGAASSYMSWLVAQKENDVVLLHTPTHAEHPDADRFRKQISEYIGLPITVVEDGRDLWQVIDDNHCLPSQFIPFCSRILKMEPAEKYYKTLNDDYILYVGYGPDEWRRMQKQTARFEHAGKKVRYPLFEQNITSNDCKRIITKEWGICLPASYKYLTHNNCIPCFKGGEKHWYKVWKHYPDKFEMSIEREKKIGKTVFKNISLIELSNQWERGKQDELFDEDEQIPCMCAF